MNHLDTLIKAGLSPKEASVYLASYELGETTASRIAQKSGIKRPTTYMELENLIKKGLVSQSERRNLKYYNAQSPKVILAILDENKKELEQNMASLLSLGSAIDKKPSVRYFEGEDGIKEAYRETLSTPNQEIQSWFSASSSVGSESFQEKYYIPERQKKNIWIRAILPDSQELKPYILKNSEQLRKSRTLDSKKFNLENEILLYGKNKTAILNYDDRLGIIIESSKIHDAIKQIFEVMWEMIPEEK
jgi:sugar-specific transcriptional regulator TrmB